MGGTAPGADERALWDALVAGEQPRYAGQRLGIHPKRVEYLCSKWARKGLYEWGVVHDLGWLVVTPNPARVDAAGHEGSSA